MNQQSDKDIIDEAVAVAVLDAAAKMIAENCGPIWRWGDGAGGHITETVLRAFGPQALVGPEETA